MPQEIPTLEFMHHTPFSKILITSANWRQSIICILSFDRFGICFNNSLWEQLDKYMCILYLLALEVFQVSFNLLSIFKDYYTLWHLVRTVKVIEIDILMGCHCTAYTSYHTIISCVSLAFKIIIQELLYLRHLVCTNSIKMYTLNGFDEKYQKS